jgi:dihydrolipoamide dehydrogenase
VAFGAMVVVGSVLIGGGAVGVEFAHFYATFGVSIMIMEQADELLPLEDQEVSALLKRSFEKRGMTVLTSTHVTSIQDMQKHFVVQIREVDEPIRTDSILVATGRKPHVDGLDIKKAGVLLSEGNRAVVVNEKMQTSQETIFAVGDVTTRPAFAHGAMAQGVYVAETIAGIARDPIALTEIPSVVFCQPEVASVGLTEAQARASGPGIKTARFPLSINGRAIVMNETEGFVKLVSDHYGQLLGAHLIGPHATELISEIVLAKHLEARGLDLKRTVHPHPTLSEAVMEAGGALFNQAIHF